jgi:hypothetical protein
MVPQTCHILKKSFATMRKKQVTVIGPTEAWCTCIFGQRGIKRQQGWAAGTGRVVWFSVHLFYPDWGVFHLYL